ncbi:MAG: hypothetical protein Q4C78_02305 [Synergistaceae bacterium]|nr:hypothetical protein [Synergistaceae bacterium]
MSIFKIATGFIVWDVLSFFCLLLVFGFIILVVMSLIMKPKLERTENVQRPSFQFYMADFYLEKLFKHFIATLFSNPLKSVEFQIMTAASIFIGLLCSVL